MLKSALDRYYSWSITLQNTDDLNLCVGECHQALQIPSLSNSSRVCALHLLGKGLCSRGILMSCLRDLQEGIEEIHNAVIEADFGSASLLGILGDLASALHARWELTGELDDIISSISIRRLLVSEYSGDALVHRVAMRDLSTAVFLRFAHFPRQSDLEEVLHLDNEILLKEDGDAAARFGDLCTLAQTLLVKWDYDGDAVHVEKSVSLLREALALRSSVHAADVALALNILSEAIQTRIYITEEDLEEALELDRESLGLVPRDDPERMLSLAALVTTLLVRYTVHNDRKDWAAYQDYHRELESLVDAVDSTSNIRRLRESAWGYFMHIGHDVKRCAITSVYRQACYIRLAETEVSRPIFRRRLGFNLYLRRLTDVVGSEVSLLRERRQRQSLTPEELQARSLRLAAIAWACRGKLLIGLSIPVPNLEDIHGYWLADLPEDDPWLFAAYVNAATDMFTLFYDLIDKEEEVLATDILHTASQYYLHALTLQMASNHPFAYKTMAMLSNTYSTLAEYNNSIPRNVVDDAVKYAQMSLAATPSGHIRERKQAADSLLIRFKLWKDPKDLEDAMEMLREGVRDKREPHISRHAVADRWADVAAEFDHESQLEAYSARVEALFARVTENFNMVGVGQSVEFLGGSEFLTSATEYCIGRGLYEEAINLLGRGRSMMWTQLLNLQRNRLNSLTETTPNEVAKLKLILEAAEMERSIQPAPLGPDFSLDEYEGKVPWLNSFSRHERLSANIKQLADKALDQGELGNTRPIISFIQSIPDGSFPVVVLNAAVQRCDALIIRGKALPIECISLDSCNRTQLDGLVEKLQQTLRETGKLARSSRHLEDRDNVGTTELSMRIILSAIWRRIVQPVMKALDIQVTAEPMRLWWYPTGPFWQLPLHAAGIYSGKGQKSVQDFVVSSYLPAFNISSPALAAPVTRPNILAVYQVETPGYPTLLDAMTEIDAIEKVAKTHPDTTFTAFGGPDATVSSIKSALPSVNIVHFALHGQQHPEKPLESCLYLADGPLKLSQLMEMHLPKAELVLLSACETAAGHEALPEEVIHLASAMVFVGFKGAIGTMWSISDCDGPPVAAETYKYLLEKERFDPRNAARALHTAVATLRQQKVPLIRWVPFIHMGI